MSATKLAIARALLLKAEASYNAGGSVSVATDGILTADDIEPTLTYLHSGERMPPPGIGGYMRRVPPSGGELGFSFGHEAKGPGVAYSASVFPSVHRALLGAGFDGAVTTTPSAEKWAYTPTPLTGTPTSLLGELYARAEKYPFTGAYLSLERIDAPNASIPLFTFAVRGLKGTFADVSFPTVTYPALTIEPPRSVNIAFALGLWTTEAVVRSWSLAVPRVLDPRGNQNAADGHAGLSPSRYTPILEALVEAPSLVGTPFHAAGGFDPYQFFENAIEVSAQLSIGSVQYNRFKVIPGKVQMAAPVGLERDGATALYRLSLQCNPTSINLNDDVTLSFD